MSEAKSNHQAKVVRIPELEKHPNADSLSIVRFGGYQVVVKTADHQPGHLAVFIQPDSVVPQREEYAFVWAGHEFPDGQVPEKYRRIRPRRFRGEWSEGLLMPVSRTIGCDDGHSLAYELQTAEHGLVEGPEGDDVADLLGITHYNPPEPEDQVRVQTPRIPKRGWRRYFYLVRNAIYSFFGIKQQGVLRGTGEKAPSYHPPVYDVEALKNYVDAFNPGEMVQVTEKIHGSNARYTFDGKKMHAGSRQMWKSAKFRNTWHQALEQNPAIEEWCRAYPGWTLYGEVTPTQKGFDYGCKPGEVKFFLFDLLSPDGRWYSPFDSASPVTILADIRCVPFFDFGPFDVDRIREYVDGPSMAPGAQHIREGVVVRPAIEREVRGLGRLQLKVVSNEFLVKS